MQTAKPQIENPENLNVAKFNKPQAIVQSIVKEDVKATLIEDKILVKLAKLSVEENDAKANEDDVKANEDDIRQAKSPSDLRILFRFNCGFCYNNYSKITVPKYFSKKCSQCQGKCDLVVLRCSSSILYGGYICSGCSARFLAVFKLSKLEQFTPFCNKCKCYTKVYQILLNKSKISVKNINLYHCNGCGKVKRKAYYSLNKIIKKNDNKLDYEPFCCGKQTSYWKLEREFQFIKLDEEGNSPSYYESLKYPSTFEYLSVQGMMKCKIDGKSNESKKEDPLVIN